jgi:hypothetical protein
MKKWEPPESASHRTPKTPASDLTQTNELALPD